MASQKILIKYATRGNPEKFFAGLNNILQMAAQPQNIVVLASIDTDDITMYNKEVMGRMKPFIAAKQLLVVPNISANKIVAINRDINLVVQPWDILVNFSDSIEFTVRGFDDIIRQKFDINYADLNGNLHFNDGSNSEVNNSLIIIGRAYFKRVGMILPPMYNRYFGNIEYTRVAEKLGCKKYFPEIIFKKIPKPANVTTNATIFSSDEAVFLTRQQQNFFLNPADIKEVIVSTPAPVSQSPVPSPTIKPRIIYFAPWYNEESPLRRGELETCVKNVFTQGEVDDVILVCENCEPPAGFKSVRLDKRPTFTDMFAIANNCSVPGDIIIIANTDIYPAPGTRDLLKGLEANQCYSLARWDEQPEGQKVHLNSRDTSDVWILRSPTAKIAGNFFMGKAGCDNAINYSIQQAGYKISNPSKSIMFYHLHNSQIKSYNPADKVMGPYLLITPHYLNEQASCEISQ